MLFIHLFGHLRLFDSEQTFEFAALPKTLPLLAYLLLERTGGPISREKVAFTLWPDETEERAKANLRRHLYDLQQALPEETADIPWLIRSRSTIHWNPAAAYWLDVAEFEKLSASPDHLAKAISLYTGDLLPDEYEDWLDVYREQYRQQYLTNLDQLISRSKRQKDFRQAIAYAKQLLTYDPLHEDVMRQYLLLRYGQGDRAGAIQAYLEFVDLLEEELKVDPLPETVAVYEAIRDDRVEELNRETSEAGGTKREPEGRINKLPAQLTSFFGRGLDLITIQELFFTQQPSTRLLTLTGPGGSGKTRLALELAARVLPKQAALFPDGIFFVDLSAVLEQEKVIDAIVDSLEIKEGSDESLVEALTRYLSSRYLLLILDNFEQVVGAGGLVSDLLAAAPGLRVMVTSRAALQLYGEHEYVVSPLPLPEPDGRSTMEGLLEFAAVSLFVARARAYRADFTLNERNSADVVRICTLLDGLPLAIELAAARIKMFSPKAMVAQLDSKLAFLSRKAKNLPVRQQTLRNTLDWSYHLLDEDEKRLFRRLALFRGSFSSEAVAEVTVGEEGQSGHEAAVYLAMDRLISLAEQSMIQFSQSEVDGQPRFMMLSTVREYAMEALKEEQQLSSLNNRYALYFAGLAAAAVEGLNQPDQDKWVSRIHEEENNLLAALNWLKMHDVEHQAQVPLAYAIAEGLVRRSHFGDSVPYYHKGIETAEAIGALKEQATGWIGLGNLYIEQGDNRQGLAAAEKAEAVAQRVVSESDGAEGYLELVTAVTIRGWALSRLGEFDAALPVAERAVELSEKAGGTVSKLIAMNLLAYLYDDVGRYQEGSTYHLGALSIARENGDRPWESTLLNNLADSYKMMGNFEGALEIYDQAYEVSRIIGYHHIEALILVNSGDVHLELGHIDKAETAFRHVLEKMGDTPPFFLAYCYILLGRACALQGNLSEGLTFAMKGFELAEEMENPEDIADSWHTLAVLAAKSEKGVVVIGRRPYSPRDCYAESAGYYEENGQEVERARLLIKWAAYEFGVGESEKGQSLLTEAEIIFKRYDLPLFLARVAQVRKQNEKR